MTTKVLVLVDSRNYGDSKFTNYEDFDQISIGMPKVIELSKNDVCVCAPLSQTIAGLRHLYPSVFF